MNDSEKIGETILDRLHPRLDDDLMAIAEGRLETAEHEMIYLRDDLVSVYPSERLESVAEQAFAERFFGTGEDVYTDVFGSRSASIYLYEETILVESWFGSHGIAIGIEPDPSLIEPTIETLREGDLVDEEQRS